jgi:cytochrome oxidase Cu insertion factor (SCO1/SenC/PrrC family)
MAMNLIFRWTLAALMVCALMQGLGNTRVAGQTPEQRSQDQRAARYACPMHPDVTSDKPGKCPRCGMDLRLVEDGIAGASSANSTASPETPVEGSLTRLRIPDAVVYDQDGKRHNFYTDLVKERVVAINFIFTTCTTICPPLTATFRRVQQELGDRVGRDVQLISVSVDPTVDTPERLRDFAAKFKAGPGWTFVTGDKNEIDSLLQALGVAVANKNDHTPMVLVGNDATGHWTRTYGLASPKTLVQVITETASHQ